VRIVARTGCQSRLVARARIAATRVDAAATQGSEELTRRHGAAAASFMAGNVRELDHAVERPMLMAEGGRVEARDFGWARRRR